MNPPYLGGFFVALYPLAMNAIGVTNLITTMVGNYPKLGPGSKAPNLRTAINRGDRGEMTAEQVQGVKEEVTAEVIQDQIRAGLDLVTDGLIRWMMGRRTLPERLVVFPSQV